MTEVLQQIKGLQLFINKKIMELIAKEGFVFALKKDLTIFGKKIDIGVNDSPDNWIEIPEPVQEKQDIDILS